MIKLKNYAISNLILDKVLISNIISRFWNEEFKKILKNSSDKHLMILIKAQFTEVEQGYRTLGHLRKVNFEDRELFINYIVERLTILSDSYTSVSINELIVTYIVREGKASDSRVQLQEAPINEGLISNHRFNNMNLPITMIPSEYGKIIVESIMNGFIRFIVSTTVRTFQIDVSLDKLVNKVTILGASDLSWTDTFIAEGCFKREIGKATIYFMDGVEVLRKQILPAKPIRRLQVERGAICT